MSRLLKKCCAFSVGMHLLLLVAVVFGMAFATTQRIPQAGRVITMTIDGGLPLGRPADPTSARRVDAPQPAQPDPPAPAQPPAVQPQPSQPPQPHAPTTPTTPAPRAVEKATPKGLDKPAPRPPEKSTAKSSPKESGRSKPNLSTKVVARHSPSSNSKSSGPSQATKIAAVIDPNAVGSLRGQMSTGVNPISFNPGASSYAGYESLVIQVYQDAWRASGWPRQFYTEMVTVRVVILADGRVKSAAVVKTSGRAPLDDTVRRAIQLVQSVGRPFPAGVKETQQTFNIDFEMRR